LQGRAVSVVLEYGKCSWGACYFCGWGKRDAGTRLEDLRRKYLRVLDKYAGRAETVKTFSSGSMLDPQQFPLDFTRWLVEEAAARGYREIVIEAKPEHVTREALEAVRAPGIRVTVALGLEVADDYVLQRLLKKGNTVEDYVRAARLLGEEGFGLRTYVLVNGHPELYKRPDWQEELLEKTLRLAGEYSTSIVVINAYPHRDSRLLLDWLAGEWRPLDKRQFYGMAWRVLERLGAERRSDDLWVLPGGVPVELDHSNFAFRPVIPRRLWERIRGVGREVLLHPHFEVWQDYFQRFYQPPPGKDIGLLIPCSYRKPYKRSKTHRAILRAISGYPWFRRLHLIVVSTPGVVPWEYHDRYPFTHYDWPEWMETEEVKRDYIQVTRERVRRYLEAHHRHYKRFYAYFHYGSETLEAIRLAFQDLGIEDKLHIVLGEEDYKAILEDLGKERVGASMVRHPIALQKLRETLNRDLAPAPEQAEPGQA